MGRATRRAQRMQPVGNRLDDRMAAWQRQQMAAAQRRPTTIDENDGEGEVGVDGMVDDGVYED